MNGTNGTKQVDVDVLVVGGGFGGVYSMHRLRQEGFSCHLFEGTHRLGGVWANNRYPGARVDSEFPFYQLTIPEVYKTWTWGLRFPDWRELQNYFDHVDKTLSISKDATYNALVESANFNTTTSRWTVNTQQGHTATCKHLLLCTGSTYKQHIPTFTGLDLYSGHLIHSSKWPTTADKADSVDCRGKKVGIIGSGSTALQIVQELTKTADSLVTFIRTPNTALPMRQRKLQPEEVDHMKGLYDVILRQSARKTFGGFTYNPPPCASPQMLSPEERETFFEELYQRVYSTPRTIV